MHVCCLFQAKIALREKPNTLVVLNDIYLQESVRWFDQLNVSFLFFLEINVLFISSHNFGRF